MSDHQTPIIFTPDNEPYLGLPSLLRFDRTIGMTLALSGEIARYTHGNLDKLTGLQQAAGQIAPQGIGIALAIRELVRQAYLFPALILMRPLIERAAIISYLCDDPQAVELWAEGWPHGKRPSLKTMLTSMTGAALPSQDAKLVCDQHNHLVHGDPASSYHNLVNLDQGRAGYAVGKVLGNDTLCDNVALEAQSYLYILCARMHSAFPEVELPEPPRSECDLGGTSNDDPT